MRPVEIEGAEQGPEYYDEVLKNNQKYLCHYTQSRYYPLWCVVADRIIRAGAMSVLDIGCGPGQVAALLRDKGLADYVGLDFSLARIALARDVCPQFKFVNEDVFETDLLEQSGYDTVITTEFLEHITEDLQVLDRVRKGTRVLASVPNFPNIAHVRHFEAARDVEKRYGPRFADFTVDEMQVDEGASRFFLFEGIKQ